MCQVSSQLEVQLSCHQDTAESGLDARLAGWCACQLTCAGGNMAQRNSTDSQRAGARRALDWHAIAQLCLQQAIDVISCARGAPRPL